MFPSDIIHIGVLNAFSSFLLFFKWKTKKKPILTSVLSTQHPNACQNIQHTTFIIIHKVYQCSCFPPFSKIFGPLVKNYFGPRVLALWSSLVYNYLMYSTIKSHFLSGFCELAHQFFTVFPLENN